MRCFRVKAMQWPVVGFCIVVLGLTGCGKKSGSSIAGSRKQTPAAIEEKSVQTPSRAPITEERVYYDFEGSLGGWEIPMWAAGKSDYIASGIVPSTTVASHGTGSMKITVDFPGGKWSAALAEIEQYLDLSMFRAISADIYIPQDAPMGLKVKMILTIGDNWKFVEMSRDIPLVPGEWSTIVANIEPGSYDWKRVVPDEKFAEDIRKIAIRIVSNRKPKYSGSIYVDNIRCGR